MKYKIKKLFTRIIGIVCVVTMGVGTFSSESKASSQQEELVKQSIIEATKILESAINKSYEKVEVEIKQKIVDKNLDYYMTMESLYRQENPYKDANYVELIAAYATAKEITDTLRIADFYSLPFIQAEVEEQKETEYLPMLVQNFKETADGVYVEDGKKYICEPLQMDTYKRNVDGTYHKTGIQEVTPKKITVTYGNVTLSGLTSNDIMKYYGLHENEDASKLLEKKVVQFGQIYRGSGLNESVFINIQKNLMTETINQYLNELLSLDLSSARIELIKEAIQLVGRVPYEWGGKATHPGYDTSWWSFDDTGSQKGLDCSGFVQWAFMTAGFDKSITDKLISTEIILGSTETIAKDELLPGDLGLLNNGQTINHVGIYLGNEYWIHCSSKENTVVIEKTDMFKIMKRVPELAESEPLEIAIQNNLSIPVENTYHSNCDYTEEEIYLLAQLIYNEANTEGMNGWIAVAEVVRNRVESELFPNTISEVIYQNDPVQFSDNQKIETRKPSEEQIFVAREVLSGNLQVLGDRNVLYFRNANGSTDEWGKYKFFKSINNHQFYTNG